MDRIPRTTTVVTLIALLLNGLLPALAASGATVAGTVEIRCDPSRLSEVASVQIRSAADGSVTSVPVDPASGAFRSPELAEGEYEILAIDTDGEPLTPEPKKLVLAAGANQILLSIQPPGCEEPAPGEQAEGKKKKFYKQKRLKDWQLTLIYVGVVTAIVLAVDTDADDDEETASPSQP